MTWMGMGGHGRSGQGRRALMPGMATNTELAQLGTLSGKQAEVLYLQLMTDHHKGGVHMAEGCVERCTVGVEKRLAQGMVDAQQSEMGLMADLLKARGAKPRADHRAGHTAPASAGRVAYATCPALPFPRTVHAADDVAHASAFHAPAPPISPVRVTAVAYAGRPHDDGASGRTH